MSGHIFRGALSRYPFMPDAITSAERALWGLSGFSCSTQMKRGQDCVRRKRGKEEGRGAEDRALECLSASALLPSAETGTLWERACSGEFCAPRFTGGELRGQCATWDARTSPGKPCTRSAWSSSKMDNWLSPINHPNLVRASPSWRFCFWAHSCA